MNPSYPVYVISKGRWQRRQTVRTLQRLGVPFRLVIEPQELEMYASVVPRECILTLPFQELGLGSIPARNWVWDHSASAGDRRHWILDDNIESVERFNRNIKAPLTDGTAFRVIEDWTDRYRNVRMAGMNYSIFCPSRENRPAIRLNTRVYSCILLCNETTHRWRGRYNEDTDLSLRFLKDGDCTALFNAFLIGKRATMTQGGGNADIYEQTDQRREFAQSLVAQHPDVASMTRKFNRWHHHVDYRRFRGNTLQRIAPQSPAPVNEYGMTLRRKLEAPR
jgi:hypothetical protein